MDNENELRQIEQKFYMIVSKRSVELEGINEMTEEEMERHR
jgi:hypothetical protein